MVARTAKTAATSKVDSKGQATMATDTSLDSQLVEKAVTAVLKYHETKSQQNDDGKLSLLGSERPLQVQFTLLRAPGRSKPKPVQIVVPHPFFKLADRSNQNEDEVEEAEICLIVKDSSKPHCQEMIENFPEHMSCVKKVLTLTSLRQKYTSYQQKRDLLHKYNVFMADDRILPMLSKALGKAFIQTKRLPVPIDLTRQKALPFAIQKALSATYMTVNTGTCVTIRAGHTGMEVEKLVENVLAVTKGAVPKMPRKWANVQLISIKTADSISLPVYNKTPEALREIAKLAGIDVDVGLGKKDDDPDVASKKVSDEDAVNKKKRSLKSPLLTALKKQKQEEKKKDKQGQDKVSEAPTPKKTSKRKATEESENTNVAKTETTRTRNTRSKKDDPPKKETADEESPKKKQKTERKEEQDIAGNDGKEATKTFIQAKKFKGSKKGYVFKMGRQGLGYYVDIKPVVDRAAMEAIQRLGKNNSRRGGQKKNKYKGTRRF